MITVFAAVLGPIWCDPPMTPYAYTQEEAQEFRQDIKDEYQTYIEALEAYLDCMSRERSRAMAEGQEQVDRYGAFLDETDPTTPPVTENVEE